MEPLSVLISVAAMFVATLAVILGSKVALQDKRSWGYLCNTAGLLAFWIVGLMPSLVGVKRPENQPVRSVEPDSLMVKHVALAEPASSLQPVGSSDEASKYIASRVGKTYHLPSCSHYVPFIKGGIWYDSEEAAKADGKRPCSECLKVVK